MADPAVWITGTGPDKQLNFRLPTGGKGDKGDTGAKGADGSNVLPTDTAIANAINGTGATKTALDATDVPTYPVVRYGSVDTTGVADSSPAINAAIQACHDGGGGRVLFPKGTIRWDVSPTLPRSGTDPHGSSVKYQPDMHFVGAGSIRGSLWGSGLVSRVGHSATVLKMGATTGPAQIDTRGTGILRISDLCFYDTNETNPIPFIQTTNTLLMLDNVSFFGGPNLIEQACVKDAIVLGGSDATTQSDLATSFFQGYGTHIKDVYFSSIRRGIYGKNAVNGILVTNPVFSLSCGGPAGYASIEFDGAGLDTIGNLVINPVIEMRGYVHSVRLGPHGKNTFLNAGFFDPSASSAACFYLFGGSSSNLAVGGNYQIESLKFVVSDGNAANGISINLGGSIYHNAGIKSPKFTVQPDAAQVNANTVFEVKRSIREATSPDLRLLNLTNEGRLGLSGAAPAFTVGGVEIGASGIVKTSGSLDLYAGAATSTVYIARGHLQHTSGTTANRPAVSGRTGMVYFDTTLGKPIWSNGSGWVDATGTTV